MTSYAKHDLILHNVEITKDLRISHAIVMNIFLMYNIADMR